MSGLNEQKVREIVREEVSGIKTDVKGLKTDVGHLQLESSRTLVLLEDLGNRFQTFEEGLNNLQGLPAKFDLLSEDVAELKVDMKMVKAVLREHSVDIAKLKSQAHTHSA